MKKIGLAICLWIGLLSSCGGNKEEFVIEGTLNNLGGQPVYAVYELDEGIAVDTLRPKNGFISLKNSSENLIPVQLYYSNKTPLTKLYVKNGDRIELSGDGENPFGLEVKGSSLNKELFAFNQTHKGLLQKWLTERNRSQSGVKSEAYKQLSQELHGVIADYVGEHRGSDVSAILVGDYLLGEADEAFCDSLIGLLNESVLTRVPAAPIELYRQYKAELLTDSVLPTFRWVTPSDTIERLNPRLSQATLLYFTTNDKFETARLYQSYLKKWRDKYSTDTLQMVEVSLDRDSAVWKDKIKKDTVKWERRWIQGGYLASGVKELSIYRLPYVIVADSVGRIITRGLSPDSLESYIEDIIYPDSLQSENR